MVLFFLACVSNQETKEPMVFDEVKVSERILKTTTTSHPTAYLMKRIGGALVEDSLLLDEGASPQSWNPSPDQVAALTDQDLIVSSGGGFEKWTERVSIPEDKWIDTSRGISIIKTEGETHSHGKDGKHSHTVSDPYIWSDPELYIQQARHVRDALVAVNPNKRDQFDEGLSALEADLIDLNKQYKDVLGNFEKIRFVSSQPAYNYIARRYSLNLYAENFDPKEPISSEVKKSLQHKLSHSKHGHHHGHGHSHHHSDSEFVFTVVLWGEEPTASVKASFPDKIQHLYIDPLVSIKEGDYDYVEQSRSNITRWKQLLTDNAAKLKSAHAH